MCAKIIVIINRDRVAIISALLIQNALITVKTVMSTVCLRIIANIHVLTDYAVRTLQDVVTIQTRRAINHARIIICLETMTVSHKR